jgi:8-oxo-dGTP pyrophosphatase MutT (NUDIX family)
MPTESWKTLRTKLVGKFAIKEVELPTGQRLDYLVVSYPESVAVLALTDDGKAVVVGQYRVAVGEYSWEIPSGAMDSGETAESSARRELEEETGYRAGRLEPMLSYHPSNSASDQVIHVWLARDLTPAAPAPVHTEPVERTIKVALAPFDELLEQVQRGEVRDASTVIAVLLHARQSPGRK